MLGVIFHHYLPVGQVLNCVDCACFEAELSIYFTVNHLASTPTIFTFSVTEFHDPSAACAIVAIAGSVAAIVRVGRWGCGAGCFIANGKVEYGAEDVEGAEDYGPYYFVGVATVITPQMGN